MSGMLDSWLMGDPDLILFEGGGVDRRAVGFRLGVTSKEVGFLEHTLDKRF